MHLEIDEGFPTHPKTLRFSALMQNWEAPWFLLRLWTWACRSAPDGDLSHMDPADIEIAVQYRLMDGKCYGAMVKAGFIDADDAGMPIAIHNWGTRTGGAIVKMAAKAARKKLYRDHKAGECKGKPHCEFCNKGIPRNDRRADAPDDDVLDEDVPETVPGTVPGQSEDKPTQTRPVKTRPDKTRPDQSGSEREIPPPPAASPGKVTGHELLRWFGQERALVLGGQPWATPPSADGKAYTFAERLSADEARDVRPTMRRMFEFIRDGAADWDKPLLRTNPAFAFGAWMSGFTTLREALQGQTPGAPPNAPQNASQGRSRASPRDVRIGRAPAEGRTYQDGDTEL